jgi:hypothetical protein
VCSGTKRVIQLHQGRRKPPTEFHGHWSWRISWEEVTEGRYLCNGDAAPRKEVASRSRDNEKFMQMELEVHPSHCLFTCKMK